MHLVNIKFTFNITNRNNPLSIKSNKILFHLNKWFAKLQIDSCCFPPFLYHRDKLLTSSISHHSLPFENDVLSTIEKDTLISYPEITIDEFCIIELLSILDIICCWGAVSTGDILKSQFL